jgi:hypothetical protein
MSLAVLRIRIWYLWSRLEIISGFWIRDLGSAVYILGHTYFLEAVWRIQDVFPGSWFLTIPDLGSRIQKQQQKTGMKQVFCHSTFYPKNCHLALNRYKSEYYFIFDMVKKTLAQFSKSKWFFYPKNCHQALKYGFGIWYPEKTYPGSRGQKGTGSRIRIRNTA